MRLNIYYCEVDHHHCGSCETASDHEYWALITPLSEDEIKTRMRAYMEANLGTHRSAFLTSQSSEGIFIHAENYCPDFERWGGAFLAGATILDLGQIKDKDVYSPVAFQELLQQRERARQCERERDRLEQEARIRARDLAELSRLKERYPDHR